MFQTAVFKLLLTLLLISSTTFSQVENSDLLFISTSFKGSKRVVSDMHLTFNPTRDTLQASIFILEDWKTADSLVSVFYLDRTASDTLYTCKERTFAVYVYKAPSGEKLFLERPQLNTYFDNYGQQRKSWNFYLAAISFLGIRQQYNAVFDCYHFK